MADLADHAYTHAIAVLGDAQEAAGVAVQAVRRGGRSRSTVLGHARDCALRSAPETSVVDLDAPAPAELTELAHALTLTRPPLERAIADLDTRHGLDRRGLGRALGLAPATAAQRAADVYHEWQRHLDPVVLARLGPGGCEALAEAMGAQLQGPTVPAAARPSAIDAVPPQPSDRQEPPATLGSLLSEGARVAEHAESCASCRDRLRAMVSVRLLLAQRPLDVAPAAVRAAAAPFRVLRFPSRPVPPAALETGSRRTHLPRTAVVVAASVMVMAIAGVGYLANRHPQQTRVDALTRQPPSGGALEVQPASVAGPFPPPVKLTNTSGRAATWTAKPDVDWVEVWPITGRLEPGQSATLRLAMQNSPEGEVRAVIRISGTDGSATVVRLSGTVERPPDVAALVRGCDVVATVEDEAEVAAATLHWTTADGAEVSVPMQRTLDGFAAGLPTAGEHLSWWVSAADARGNRSRTASTPVPPGSCA